MPLFYQPGIPQGIHYLDPEESRHAAKVLRLKEGDSIELTDGIGNFYEARITSSNFTKCLFTILNTRLQPARPYRIHIAIAPTKNTDRIEWFVEKSVELGIDQISFAACKNSERKSLVLERLEKLAISAMKQSVQAWLPSFSPLRPFSEIIKIEAGQKFIAFVDVENPVHLMSAAKAGGDYLVLIGPEGDFTNDELKNALDHGFQKVSLGNHRLRTETAGIAACQVLNLLNR